MYIQVIKDSHVGFWMQHGRYTGTQDALRSSH